MSHKRNPPRLTAAWIAGHGRDASLMPALNLLCCCV